MVEFKGKNVLITGSASGIGKAFAHYFFNRGSRLILVDIDGENLEKVSKNLRKGNSEPLCYVKDLSIAEERVSIYEDLKTKGIELDILINDAAIGYWGYLTEASWERIDRVIDLNVKGTTHLTWLFLPQMLQRNSGAIINVSSTGTFCGTPNTIAYSATKAYVANFTEGLDIELLNTGIRTLTAYPGATDTNFWTSNGVTVSKHYKRKKMSPEAVVEDFMNAFNKGKASIIAGRKNRAMVFFSRLIPRPLLKRLAFKRFEDVK